MMVRRANSMYWQASTVRYASLRPLSTPNRWAQTVPAESAVRGRDRWRQHGAARWHLALAALLGPDPALLMGQRATVRPLLIAASSPPAISLAGVLRRPVS